jgi:hypothetical protein
VKDRCVVKVTLRRDVDGRLFERLQELPERERARELRHLARCRLEGIGLPPVQRPGSSPDDRSAKRGDNPAYSEESGEVSDDMSGALAAFASSAGLVGR